MKTFFEKYFKIFPGFPSNLDPYEISLEGKLLGKIIEASEFSGTARIFLEGLGNSVVYPPAIINKLDGLYRMRAGIIYRIFLHLIPDLPENIDIKVKLFDKVKLLFSLLDITILKDGKIYLYVIPTVNVLVSPYVVFAEFDFFEKSINKELGQEPNDEDGQLVDDPTSENKINSEIVEAVDLVGIPMKINSDTEDNFVKENEDDAV